MHLLTLNQTKMLKSGKYGYLSAILNLAPAFKYKGNNTCPYAGQCKGFCLQHTGRNRFDKAIEARERRTKLYYDEPETFLTLLRADLTALQLKAKRERLTPTVRLNGLSDIEWSMHRDSLMDAYPLLQFIDYTKDHRRLFYTIPVNYHFTYSVNEKTPEGTIAEIYKETRFNCAVVFNTKRGEPLPKTYAIDGITYPVIDGDLNDLRHLDKKGAIVGLRYKYAIKNHKAIHAKRSGFIILEG